MDPIQINITIGLNEKTLAALQAFNGSKGDTPKAEPAPETKPAPRQVETKPAKTPETKEPAQAAAPEPEKPAEISDEELRAVLYKARKSSPTAAQTIKNVIFPEFGITTSIDCPMEQRAQLVARLNSIAS